MLGSVLMSCCIANGNNGTAIPTTTNPLDNVKLTDIWKFDIGEETEIPPIQLQNGICVFMNSHMLFVSGEGDVVWDRPLSGEVFYVDALPVSDGSSIYITYIDGSIERRDGATGEVVWRRSVCAYPQFAPMCVYRESLYVSTPDGYLLRLLADTGDTVWLHELPEGPAYSSIVPCGEILLIDSFSYNITVLDADTGAILDIWEGKYDMFNIVVHDDAIYTPGFNLTRYNANTGILEWEYNYIEWGGTWTRMVANYPFIFVPTVHNQLLCFDMESGELLWSDDAMYRAGLAISGNILISGIAEIPDLYKANTETDEERELVAWDISTGERLLSMPADQDLKWPVAIDDRFIFVAGTQLVCYAVEYEQQ